VEVFDRLGHPVVPVIAYFVNNGSSQYLLQETVGQGLSRLWNETGGWGSVWPRSRRSNMGSSPFTNSRIAGMRCCRSSRSSRESAVRRQFTRTLLGAKNIVFGGVSDLEGVIARGERLPSWGEMGWAAFDAVIVVGAWARRPRHCALQGHRWPWLVAERCG
jgi:hypothetical protein